VLELDLPRPAMVGIVDLREPIALGQAVAAHQLEGRTADGRWHVVSRGTTIGYRRLLEVPPMRLVGLRVTITDAVTRPEPLHVGCYAPA